MTEFRHSNPVFVVPDIAEWYGDTEFVLRDLNGYVLVISQ